MPADVDALVMERIQSILHSLAAHASDPWAVRPEPAAEPDWNLVKRHYRRYGNPEATVALGQPGIDDLADQIHRSTTMAVQLSPDGAVQAACISG